jgi:hypothetical protein
MGVISLNVSLEVEQWYRGLPRGKRSEILDRHLRDYVRARLGDQSSASAWTLSPIELIDIAIEKVPEAIYDDYDILQWMNAQDKLKDMIVGKAPGRKSHVQND